GHISTALSRLSFAARGHGAIIIILQLARNFPKQGSNRQPSPAICPSRGAQIKYCHTKRNAQAITREGFFRQASLLGATA
ncbi:MAG: hypothetical protein WAK98_16400, partial [Gemmobacter sp.]